MRSQKDPEFSDICDRVGNGKYRRTDLNYLKACVRDTDSENHNDNFKTGNISIIVITNKRRQEINEAKLNNLLVNERTYEIVATDRSTNLEIPPEVPSRLKITQTSGLEKCLRIKFVASIVITSNHQLAKYKEDGIVNGARGYIDSFQVSKKNIEEVEVIWVIFKDESVGRLLRYDYNHLKKIHKPDNQNAVPILKQKKYFTINKGEVRFQRNQFPITFAYAISTYKCQGDTLEEVIIDFSHEPGEKSAIQSGSFYVALTRVKEGKNVYLKSFDEKYITSNAKVEEKIDAMRKFKAYKFKKIYLADDIFKENDDEIKLGYFNMRGFLESNHAKCLDHDHNLLNLHLLVVTETWLGSDTSNNEVIEKLRKWKVFKCLDATDNKKHMGLLFLAPVSFLGLNDTIYSLDYVEGYTEGRDTNEKTLLYQGIVLDHKKI